MKAFGAMPPAAAYQQNLGSFLARLFVRDAWNPSPLIEFPGLVKPLLALIVAGGLYLLYRLSRRAANEGRAGVIVGTATILGVATAPMLYDYHYSLLILPIVIVYQRLREGPGRGEILLFGAAIFLLTARVPYESAFFADSLPALLAFPRLAGGAALLILAGRGAEKRQIH